MSTFTRVLAWIAPSTPRTDRALIFAATRCRDTTPAPSVCGEAALGAGGTPEGEGPVPSSDPCDSARTPLSPSGPPAVERHQSHPVHPSRRYLFEDRNLAGLLTLWSREQNA